MKNAPFLKSLCLISLISLFISVPQHSGLAASNIPEEGEVIKILGKPSKQALPNRRLKFLVWNLYKGSESSFAREYIYLGYSSDIIMAQEIFLDKKMSSVFKLLPQYLSTTATSFFSGKDQTRTGVANKSSVAPSSIDYLRTVVREPIVGTPKVTLITTYPIRYTDKKLTVVTIHAINFVSTTSFNLEMNRLYEKLKNLPKPMVFAGDFNTWNKDRMNILKEIAKKLDLKEATFSPDNRMTFNGYPLDHFLYSDDLVIRSAKVEDWSKGSDHKPLQVEVEFKKESDQVALLN